MSFALMRGFRPLSRIVHPSLVNSYFLGGPSAKTMIPVASGTATQPVSLRHPTANMAVFTSSDHWKVERVVAVAMLAIIPGSFVYDSALMNYLLAATMAIHAHWGMDAALIDYCPRKALPFANLIRYLMTAIAFGGLCYFNYNDMGLTKALKALWALH
jgi:succinate dehydrogenase (ubiquinone) membrane anchor subunit